MRLLIPLTALVGFVFGATPGFVSADPWSGDPPWVSPAKCFEDYVAGAPGAPISRFELACRVRRHEQWLRGYVGGGLLPPLSIRFDHLRPEVLDTSIPEVVASNYMVEEGRLSLQGASLWNPNLVDAYLWEANLVDAYLWEANLQGAHLQGANLQGAVLREANLQGIGLGGANLLGADLKDANLQDATLRGAILTFSNFEPISSKLPTTANFEEVRGLHTLEWSGSPSALSALRKQFKDDGARDQERAITFAIKRSELRKRLTNPKHLLQPVFAVVDYVAFDYTTRWGYQPWRALVIALGLLFLFAYAYTGPLLWPHRKAGVWKIPPVDTLRPPQGDAVQTLDHLQAQEIPTLVKAKGVRQAIGLALWFSILSAFHIGWRDLNVGTWLSRLQPKAYGLQATGWVRTVSGIQSLLTVYLIAIWALTHFGRPFE